MSTTVQEREDKFIRDALETARALTILADECEGEVVDDGCLLVISVIRDAAEKIRRVATMEKEEHQNRRKR